MLRIGVAPCSPFSVTGDLLRADRRAVPAQGCADAHPPVRDAGRGGVLPAAFRLLPGGVRGVARLAGPGRVARPLRCTCPTRRSPAWPATGTSVAHCPTSNARLGAGIARARDLRDAGVAVGLGVDGAASNEACSLLEEARHALLFARAKGGPQALTVRDALEMATMGGARVLGRRERDRLAGGGQARRPRGVAAGHVGAHRHRRPGRRPGARRAAAAGTAAGQRPDRRRAGPAVTVDDGQPRHPRVSRRQQDAAGRAGDTGRRPDPDRSCSAATDEHDP